MIDRSLNLVIVMGTVGKDPEQKTLQNGNTVANVSIATDEGYYNDSHQWVDRTEWHKITVWGKMCEKCMKVKKGDVLMVEGKIHTDSWDDPQTGQKRYATCIIAARLKLVYDQGRAKAAKDNGGFTDQNYGPPQNQQPQMPRPPQNPPSQAQRQPAYPPSTPSQEDELPF